MTKNRKFKCNRKFNPPDELKFLRHDDFVVIVAVCTDYSKYCQWHGKICK